VRFTIERLRTLVLAAGVLLVIALAMFLAVGKWKRHFNVRELLKPLGANIQQEANGWTYEHALGAHSQYKIYASKEVQFKQGNAVLHDVKIELYGEDGSRVDRIEGKEFEYDQNKGTVSASGPVEITLMRPSVTPAVAPKAKTGQVASEKTKENAPRGAAQTASSGEIHVETSGLVFNQKSGVATTAEHVEFSLTQGTGSSTGALYDSQQGNLVLDHDVELNTRRGSEPVVVHARHGEFERDTDLCQLQAARADYRGGNAKAADAKIYFREDGSAVRLDATGGFTLDTATGSHIEAPTGAMDFDEHSQPRHGHLQGGVTMDSLSQGDSRNGIRTRHMHGTSPTADFDFTLQGELHHMHLERGVEMNSEEQSEQGGSSAGGPLRVSRTWRSPLADVEFREISPGKVEPATIHGSQGVVVTGESQRGKGTVLPSRLASDELTGAFGPDSVLSALTGTGHASVEETTATGLRQSSAGDRLEVHFAPSAKSAPETMSSAAVGLGGAAQIQSAEVDGHVVLIQWPAASSVAPAPAPMRATAGRAVYESVGEWLHLTLSPRVEDGGLQLTADKIDLSHDSGNAFAHGNVKATWFDPSAGKADSTLPARQGIPANAPPRKDSMALGGQGPSHVIADEAELQQASGVATFRGHARLWQQANSVTGPLIVMDRQKQTLVARSTDPAEPVRAVLLSASSPTASKDARSAAGKDGEGKSHAPSVIRVRGGDLKYSDAERKAVMRGGALGTVEAETGTATSVSDEVELTLLPPGNHAGKDGAPGQVDRMTASGHVVLSSLGRRGTGDLLVYTNESGEYVLTGSAASPPKMVDPAQGTVTGEVLKFDSRDSSVSAEGSGQKTITETTAPK
jgi:lipopolysaccharide export system protein LptA